MLCIEHTFGVDTRGISLVYVLCAKYLKNCSSTNCTKKVQFLHKISLKTPSGDTLDALAQDWADFKEIKRYMLEKYKRKLGENKEIHSVLYAVRQFTSFEAYINALDIKMTNIKDPIP